MLTNNIIDNLVSATDIIEYNFKDKKNKTIVFTYLYELFYKINTNINRKKYNIRNDVYLILSKIVRIIDKFIKINKRKYNYIYLRTININLMNIKLYINDEQCLDEFILNLQGLNNLFIENKHFYIH